MVNRLVLYLLHGLICFCIELKHNNMGKDIDRRLDALYLKSFGGFLMIIGADGFVTYLSENVSLFLGLSQVHYTITSPYNNLQV